MLGIVFALAAALCWGAGAIFTRLGLQHIRASSGTMVSMLSSLALIGIIALSANFKEMLAISLGTLVWFSLVGLLNYVIGRQANILSVQYIGVTRSSAITASSPLFAMIIAVVFIGERIDAMIIAGTLCVVAGLFLLVTSK